jgi:UDPglucose--hexose-1-phosphate uridylyltransferase
MSELRKDYVTNTWVIFAPARSLRPGIPPQERKTTPPEACPFCEGHEDQTPPEVLAFRDGGRKDGPGWRVRCFPNLFPALVPGEVKDESSAPLFGRVSGVGRHEVIVETPEHAAHLGSMPASHVGEVVRAYRDRARSLSKDPAFRYVLIFKNHGERAGASLSHPHSQLVALPIVPRRIHEELEVSREHRQANRGACVFCRIVSTEIAEDRRVITQNRDFVALAPYAARFPFETWILPKAHAAAFEALTDSEVSSFADLLRESLRRLHQVVDDPDFNYNIHTGPVGAEVADFHWHLEITPRLAELAGFEQGTGMFINQVMPEDAASILRGDVRLTGRNDST